MRMKKMRMMKLVFFHWLIAEIENDFPFPPFFFLVCD